jgi:hypothetical protein
MTDKRNDTSAQRETVTARREIGDMTNRQFKKKGTS